MVWVIGYEMMWVSVVKKGYSGMVIFSWVKLKSIMMGINLLVYD